MSVRSIKQVVAAGFVASTLAACADAPATAPVLSGKSPALAVWSGSITKFARTALLTTMTDERFVVCKDFTGAALAYPSAEFSVTITPYNGAAFDPVAFTLDDGQCADLGLFGGLGVDVSVTENGITDYATSYAIGTITTTGGVSTWNGFGPSSSGYTASGSAYGNRGAHVALGTVIEFTNDYQPPAGCTYTLGYWKTHSEFGPAPYDDTWAQLANGASTAFYLSGTSWISVFNTAPAGNAYYQLAHQFMAAKLNALNGASVPSNVASAISQAHGLFNSYTPAQAAALPKNGATRALFISLAGVLGSYNTGASGPGHCGSLDTPTGS